MCKRGDQEAEYHKSGDCPQGIYAEFFRPRDRFRAKDITCGRQHVALPALGLVTLISLIQYTVLINIVFALILM